MHEQVFEKVLNILQMETVDAFNNNARFQYGDIFWLMVSSTLSSCGFIGIIILDNLCANALDINDNGQIHFLSSMFECSMDWWIFTHFQPR